MNFPLRWLAAASRPRLSIGVWSPYRCRHCVHARSVHGLMQHTCSTHAHTHTPQQKRTCRIKKTPMLFNLMYKVCIQKMVTVPPIFKWIIGNRSRKRSYVIQTCSGVTLHHIRNFISSHEAWHNYDLALPAFGSGSTLYAGGCPRVSRESASSSARWRVPRETTWLSYVSRRMTCTRRRV